MDNLQLSQGGNLCFGSGALANGSNAGTVQTAATIPYTINGVWYSKSGTNNITISYDGPDVYSVEGNGAFTGKAGGAVRLYGLYLDEDGAVSVLPGPIANVAKLAAGEESLQFPPTQRRKAYFGAIRVQVTENTTFIPGTTALDASGVTVTYLNGSSPGGEPLLA